MILILCIAFALVGAGCGMKQPSPKTASESMPLPQKQGNSAQMEVPSPRERPHIIQEEIIEPPSKPSAPSEPVPEARILATASLVEQGKAYLDKGKPDQALNVFERALSVYPGNGKTYYYMAEAWAMKKNKRQALEFNRLARMYLGNHPEWRDKVGEQRNRIESMP